MRNFAAMEHTYETLYRSLCSLLGSRFGRSEAQAQAFALLEDMYGASRTDVLMGRSIAFDAAGEQAWASVLEALERGEAMQYVEQLVEMAVEAQPKRAIDCGTGSGCIAVSIALALPGSEVWACDISEAALEIARDNARRHGARVNFLLRSMLDVAAWGEAERFDLIVSNPPYICESEAEDMEAGVLDCEPHLALFVPDADALRFYKALSKLGRRLLRHGGWLMAECNTRYAADVAALWSAEGFADAAVLNDCFGLPRMVKAQWLGKV